MWVNYSAPDLNFQTGVLYIKQCLSSLLPKGFRRKKNVMHQRHKSIIICNNNDNYSYFSFCFP